MSNQQIGCTHPSLGIRSLRDDGSAARWGCVMCGIEFVPERKFVGLTDEEIHKMTVLMGINPEWKAEMEIVRSVVRNLEAKLREKNA